MDCDRIYFWAIGYCMNSWRLGAPSYQDLNQNRSSIMECRHGSEFGYDDEEWMVYREWYQGHDCVGEYDGQQLYNCTAPFGCVCGTNNTCDDVTYIKDTTHYSTFISNLERIFVTNLCLDVDKALGRGSYELWSFPYPTYVKLECNQPEGPAYYRYYDNEQCNGSYLTPEENWEVIPFHSESSYSTSTYEFICDLNNIYNLTYSPTLQPTLIPTLEPTLQPTTAIPSINPTINPTINPSTNKPTQIPSSSYDANSSTILKPMFILFLINNVLVC